jgi:hypothetical protein
LPTPTGETQRSGSTCQNSPERVCNTHFDKEGRKASQFPAFIRMSSRV